MSSLMQRAFVFLFVIVVLLSDAPSMLAQKKHPAEDKARSLKSDVETSIEFYNQGQEILKVYWLNLEGKRELKATLKPGERQTQKTFLNHAWVLTDEKDNALGLYYPDADKRVVAFGEPKFLQKGKGGFGGGANPFGGGDPFPPFGGKGKKGAPAAAPRIDYVQHPSALAELKLNDKQAAQVKDLDAKYQQDVQGLTGTALQKSRKTTELKSELDRSIANLLDPAQNKRLEQMQRQDLGAGLFTDQALIGALQLSAEQQVKLAPIRTQFNTQRLDALKADAKAGPEFVKKLVDARKTAFDATFAVLTPDQKKIWNDLVGNPWNGIAPNSPVALQPTPPGGLNAGTYRTRAFAFNNFAISNSRLLSEQSVRDALKLTADQLKTPSLAALTPDQLKKYQGIYLQQSMAAYGPAGKFRYKVVLDLLNLTEDQKTKILAIGQEDGKTFSSLGGANLSSEALQKLNKATEEKLDAVLTADQRTALKGLIGEPFTGTIENPLFSGPTGFKKGVGPADVPLKKGKKGAGQP